MDIKLFSLCNEESPTVDKGKQYILQCARIFSEDCREFSHFTSQKRMLLSISQSLLSSEIIIIAVQEAMYNATKKLLCAALDIKPEENFLVMEQLTAKLNCGKIKQNVYKNNILFPPDAEIFPTRDYINCGFAISSGSQHIIYLPIDTPKADEVVLGSLYDYLVSVCEPEMTQTAFDYRKEAIFKRTATKLSEENVDVSISPENIEHIIAPVLSKKASHTIRLEKIFNDFIEPDSKLFAIKSARTVRDGSNSTLGASISEILSDDNGNRFAYIAVADENDTRVLKIYAESDESDERFKSICVDRLMLLLYNYNELGTEDDESIFDRQNDKKLKSIIGIAFAGLTLAASITGFILALILNTEVFV